MERNADDNTNADAPELLALLLIRKWFSDTPGLSTWSSVTAIQTRIAPIAKN